MAEHRNVNYSRICRIDDDTGYRLRIIETRVSKGFAGIRRFVNAIAKAGTLAIVGFAGSDPNDVRVRWRNSYVADRGSRIVIKNRRERRAIIRRFPDAAGGQTYVIDVWIALDRGDVINTPTHARRADAAKHEAFEHRILRPIDWSRGRTWRRSLWRRSLRSVWILGVRAERA